MASTEKEGRKRKRKEEDKDSLDTVSDEESRPVVSKADEKWFVFSSPCTATQKGCSGRHHWVWTTSQIAHSDSISTIATAFAADHPSETVTLELECDCEHLDRLVQVLGKLYSDTYHDRLSELKAVDDLEMMRICNRIRKYHSEPTQVFLKMLRLYEECPARYHPDYTRFMTVLRLLPEKHAKDAMSRFNQWLWSTDGDEDEDQLQAYNLSGRLLYFDAFENEKHMDAWIHETGFSELMLAMNIPHTRDTHMPELVETPFFQKKVLNSELWTPDLKSNFSWGPCDTSALDLFPSIYPEWLESSDFRSPTRIAVIVPEEMKYVQVILNRIVSWLHPKAVCILGNNELTVFRIGQYDSLHIQLIQSYHEDLFTRPWNGGFYDAVGRMLYSVPGWLDMAREKRLVLSGFALYKHNSALLDIMPLILRGFSVTVHFENETRTLPKDVVVPTIKEWLAQPADQRSLEQRLDLCWIGLAKHLVHGPVRTERLAHDSQEMGWVLFRPDEWKASSKLLINRVLVNDASDDPEEGVFIVPSRRVNDMRCPHHGDEISSQEHFLHPIRIFSMSRVLRRFRVLTTHPRFGVPDTIPPELLSPADIAGVD